jgi:hypothetical protein
MEELMSDEARETNSVTDLKHQLQQLQEEVDEASEVRCCCGPPKTFMGTF